MKISSGKTRQRNFGAFTWYFFLSFLLKMAQSEHMARLTQRCLANANTVFDRLFKYHPRNRVGHKHAW